MRAKVALIGCDSYREESVVPAVRRGIDLLGGPGALVGKGERILLKPNMLYGDRPERCSTTHPIVLKAVGSVFRHSTDHLLYGDSPGFGRPKTQLQLSGLAQAAGEVGASLADFSHGRELAFKDSPFTKRFTLARGVLESDGIVSIAKLKTHQFTRITGAVKNQFGIVPGLLKTEYHVKMPNVFDFARMLVSLNLVCRPRLYVLDGIMAMEGNGPRSGEPVKMGVLLFSTDPVALDAVVCRLIDLEPEYVPTMKPGREWGLGTYRSDEIELVGDPIERFRNPHFNVNRKPVRAVAGSGFRAAFKTWISPRPEIDPGRCGRCGVCVKVCPVRPKALIWNDPKHEQPPVYDYQRCIRCFCCQELCPEKAIYVNKPLLGKIFFAR